MTLPKKTLRPFRFVIVKLPQGYFIYLSIKIAFGNSVIVGDLHFDKGVPSGIYHIDKRFKPACLFIFKKLSRQREKHLAKPVAVLFIVKVKTKCFTFLNAEVHTHTAVFTVNGENPVFSRVFPFDCLLHFRENLGGGSRAFKPQLIKYRVVFRNTFHNASIRQRLAASYIFNQKIFCQLNIFPVFPDEFNLKAVFFVKFRRLKAVSA